MAQIEQIEALRTAMVVLLAGLAEQEWRPAGPKLLAG